MAYSKPEKIMEITVTNGTKKVKYPPSLTIILGFEAGAFIALGYFLFIRVTATLPANLSGLGSLIGASVFPIGLILTLLAGGELLTGNMMAVPLAKMANFVPVFLGNAAGGSIFIAMAYWHAYKRTLRVSEEKGKSAA